MAKPLKVCICGGGSSAQIMAALSASRPGTEVNVLALYQDEAERWSKAIENSDMTIYMTDNNGKKTETKSKPNSVSKDPNEVVPGSDLIILVVPAFAHEEYLKAVVGHIDKKAVIVGIPGQPGFEFLCKSLLGDLVEQITLMSFEMSPWMRTIVEYGVKIDVTRVSKTLNGSILRGKAIPRKPPLMGLQMLLGYDPALKQVRHFIEILFTSYSFVHPAIMYGMWKDWDGKPFPEEPPFFHGVDEATAKLIENCSKEYQDVAHAISGKKPEVGFLSEIQDIYNWYVAFYKDDIEDSTSLLQAIVTNKSYRGVVHPMKKGKNRFTPDFTHRYITEDIPFGMVVVRGVAEIVGIDMPCCDLLIEWGQDKMGKKYLLEGKVAGPNINETRAPQRFGITTLDEVLKGQKSTE